MRLLLDSHILYWALTSPGKLTDGEKQVLENSLNDVLVSPASLWELQIKAGKGKLKLPRQFSEAIISTGFSALDITMAHANAIASLPNLHNDPFDRILVAQAKSESLTLVTRDDILNRYPIAVLDNETEH